MSNDYFQPPMIPGMSTNAQGVLSGNYGPNANPFYSVGNQFLPRNLHDIIKWTKYIIMQSPVTTEVLRKLATYPITEFDIDTEAKAVRSKYEQIFKSFSLKQTLHNIGFDYHSIGNVFLSIYYPIHRDLICPHCKQAVNIKVANHVVFREYCFKGTCPKCNHENVTFKINDTKSLDIERMNIIKWDPTHIAVNHNPITGEYEYFYKVPNDVKRRIQQGDRLFLNTIPWSLVEAVKNNQDYQFEDGYIYHLKNISASQSINGVAVPPLVSLFPLVFYQATLRKANESVATDFMSPLRVIFPQPQTSNSDPVVSISMQNFTARMQQAMIAHKRDKNHVLIAPVPIGYQAISGEGKTLLVNQEIMQAEESILLALGASKELLSGTTNWTSSTVGLRLFENTLNCYTSQVDGFIDWVMTKVCLYLSLEKVQVKLTPFRLTDDDQLRQLLIGLVSTNKASMQTLFESFGMNYDEEIERMKNEKVSLARAQIESEVEVNLAQFLAAKEQNAKFDKDDSYKNSLAKAQQIAEMLMGVDEGTRRQELNNLEIGDYGMYLMVSKLMEKQREQAGPQQVDEMGNPVAAPGGAPGEGGAPGQPGQQGGGGAPGAGGEGGSMNEGAFGVPTNMEGGVAAVPNTQSAAPPGTEKPGSAGGGGSDPSSKAKSSTGGPKGPK